MGFHYEIQIRLRNFRNFLFWFMCSLAVFLEFVEEKGIIGASSDIWGPLWGSLTFWPDLSHLASQMIHSLLSLSPLMEEYHYYWYWMNGRVNAYQWTCFAIWYVLKWNSETNLLLILGNKNCIWLRLGWPKLDCHSIISSGDVKEVAQELL